MSPSHVPFPPADQGLRLHQNVLQDCDYWYDVCDAYYVPLLAWIERVQPDRDPHLRQEAVNQALFDYLRQPERYDPTRLELGAYLRMAARNDLLNLLRREHRHLALREAWEFVEEVADDGNTSIAEPVESLIRAEDVARTQAYFARVAATCTPIEQGVLDLMRDEERRTSEFARVMGIETLPLAEQEAEVKRMKDRLKKRLQRAGGSDD